MRALLPTLLALGISLDWMLQTINGYLVNSSSCQIPNYDPFHESIRPFYKRSEQRSCQPGVLPLTTVTSSAHKNTLHFHRDRLELYYSRSHSRRIQDMPIVCCYRLIAWGHPDWFRAGPCELLVTSLTFTGPEEFVEVICERRFNNRQPKLVYNNFHAFIGFNDISSRKIKQNNDFLSTRHTLKKGLSVMIIGLDSMSRLNMMRTMPKTVNYLEQTGWYTFKGYNKIADNTFPNLAAMLTGMSETQLVNSCWPTPKTPLDNCPIMWKKFSDNSYITAYAEDQPGMGSFNNAKRGFRDQPTDYYLRPFMLAVDYNIYNVGRPGYGNFYTGSECQAEFIFNYSISFASAFHPYRTFSLFWVNSISHNDLNTPSAMDEYVIKYLRRLKYTGIFDRSVILFLSDHGLRVGPTLETYIGYLEERLPFMHMWLPETFRRAYPSTIRNLERNTYRLTSPFDVYMTLLDILGQKHAAKGCPKCKSLFDLAPWNRTCADAGIPDHWCSCGNYDSVSVNSDLARKLAVLLVDKLNQILAFYRHYVTLPCRCANFKVGKILFIRERKCNRASCEKRFVVIAIQVIPGYAKFEATLSNKHNMKNWEVLDGISRLNSYGNESVCVNHYLAKEYCFCLCK